MVKLRTGRHVGKTGMTLLELVIALALAAFLVLGLVQIAAAASASTQLQRNQALIQENARAVIAALSRVIRRAGFNPQPWQVLFHPLGIAELSLDDVSGRGDRLSVRDWSDLNCFDNQNPDKDVLGRPLFYVRESTFDLNTSGSLTHQCRYGPSLENLITQVRRQGFINNIEMLEVLYGLDVDFDGNIEAWVAAGEWDDPQQVIGVRLGLLLSSEEVVMEPASKAYEVLDSTVNRPADGKLRRVVEFATAIRGKTG